MWERLFDVLMDAVIDSVKLLPFLFATYLVMELIESRAGEKTEALVRKSGRFGPVIGGVLGVVPQCGFSAAAANLYAGRVITAGTLLAVFWSTSDEMLPILISEMTNHVTAGLIIRILLIKAIIAVIAGMAVDLVIQKKQREENHLHIHDLCEHDHCHCERGVLYSAFSHTMQIFIFIFLITFVLNMVIDVIGEDTISGLVLNRPFLGEILAGLVGLIPNCASSVVLTRLYLGGAMSGGALAAGLLVSAGVGILVLCRVNRHPMENAKLIAILYVVGILAGMLVGTLNIL